MSIPRPSVYDVDFLKYPVLPITSRVIEVTSTGMVTASPCEATRINQYRTSFPWGETAGTHAQGSFVIAGGRCHNGLLHQSVLVGQHPTKLSPAKPMPKPRARHAMTTLPDGSVIAVGGVTIADDDCLELARDIFRYDVLKDSWEVFAALPKRACQLVAECIGNKLYVIAGDTGPITEPEKHAHPAFCRDDVQVLDLGSMQWSSGNPKPTPESGVTSAVHDGKIYVCSSGPTVGTIDDLLEIYDPSADSLHGPANSPPEAGSIRHLRPVETATPGRRHRAVRRG